MNVNRKFRSIYNMRAIISSVTVQVALLFIRWFLRNCCKTLLMIPISNAEIFHIQTVLQRKEVIRNVLQDLINCSNH